MSEYEITRSLASWKETQSTSYLVVGNQLVNPINVLDIITCRSNSISLKQLNIKKQHTFRFIIPLITNWQLLIGKHFMENKKIQGKLT